MGKIRDFYTPGAVSDPYGSPRDNGTRRHRGVDLSHSREPGTVAVPAARAGRVVGKRRESKDHGFGNGILIESTLDDGNLWIMSYNHGHYYPDQQIGSWVEAGEIILHEGTTGSTDGSCVHIEQQRVGGSFTDPLEELLLCASRDGGSTPSPHVGAPAFPLAAGYYFGPRDHDFGVSGYFSHREDFRQWQRQMKARGWEIEDDGLYGDQSGDVAEAFQAEKGLAVDRHIGPDTWAAAWTAPIT